MGGVYRCEASDNGNNAVTASVDVRVLTKPDFQLELPATIVVVSSGKILAALVNKTRKIYVN